jgi:hypothetical protein
LAGGDAVCDAIAALKTDDVTGHIPVTAFAVEGATPVMKAAQRADAKLVASETTIANYLPELLNQALQIE